MRLPPVCATVLLLILGVLILEPTDLYAQESHASAAGNGWFGLLELPFLALCIFFAFVTARALKGGIFGRGMLLLAWGFLVMAVGHLCTNLTSLIG